MKVMTIVGTRPDLIKLSEIIKRFDRRFNHVLVHTGQNNDPLLTDVFINELVRKPDYNLCAADDTLGKTLSKIMVETENVILAEKPDAVVILGDTNSSLAGIIVKRYKIPLFHLEAGNRCFDDNVPEEVNRRIIDHIADVNLAFSENARRYLISEGRPKDRTFLMGSPMKEVIVANLKRIKKSKILKELKIKNYYLVSIHRNENLENIQNFTNIVVAINSLAKVTNSPVVVTVHPHTQKKITEYNIKFDKRVKLCAPFGFINYARLQQKATCVISDSGTVAEESAILGFPAVTVRNAMERPEAIDNGSILLVQPDAEAIIQAVCSAKAPTSIPIEYDIDNCSDRVINIVQGYTGYVKRYVWHE